MKMVYWMYFTKKHGKEGRSIESGKLELLKQVAAGIAAQFGSSCEVVVHDLSRHADHTIVAIENGHVTGRKVGDGASYVVIEQLATNDPQPRDHLCYLTKTPDGKILKSSTIYIRNSKGKVSGILAINYDISRLLMVDDALHELVSTGDQPQPEPERPARPERPRRQRPGHRHRPGRQRRHFRGGYRHRHCAGAPEPGV